VKSKKQSAIARYKPDESGIHFLVFTISIFNLGSQLLPLYGTAVDMRRAAISKLADRLSKEEERLKKNSAAVAEQLAAVHSAENARDALVEKAIEVERTAGEAAQKAGDAEREQWLQNVTFLDSAAKEKIKGMEDAAAAEQVELESALEEKLAVGLYKLSAVDPQLESACFQPLSL
jgi:hypothetical protein